jgi:hypothetical protein
VKTPAELVDELLTIESPVVGTRFVREKSAQENTGIPQLLEPKSRALLASGRRGRGDTWVWVFKWSEVKGAEAYDLHVIG